MMTMDSSRQIEEQASLWLARRDLEGFGAAERAALEEWLGKSTAHRVAYLRLAAGWTQAGRLTALAAGIKQDSVPAPGLWQQPPFFESAPAEANDAPENIAVAARSDRPRRLRLSPLRAVAAAIVLVAAGAGTWVLWPKGDFYKTAVGGLEAVPMSDGSSVTLNTDTGVFVAMTSKERSIELRKGEAYFEVARDSTRPFVVRTDAERIVALGTRFSVRRDQDAVRIVVTEGRVRIESRRQWSPGPGIDVSAGEIARAGDSGVVVEKITLPEAENYVSWRQGFVVFREIQLREAVAEFNRYTARKIVIGDPSIDDLRISGHFRSNNVESFVRLLAGGHLVHFEERGDQIILSRP
jgi:transmembrane sensor